MVFIADNHLQDDCSTEFNERKGIIHNRAKIMIIKLKLSNNY